MSLTTQQLFFKNYAVEVLELKGDYETWVRDIEAYFDVSGFPETFRAISDYTQPTWEMDRPDGSDEDEMKQRYPIMLAQARYSVWRGIGPTIKREIAKEGFITTTVLDLWIAVRSCFFLRDESTVQQLRDDIASWDVEKAGSWSLFIDGLERYYSRLDIVAGQRSFTPSDKLHKLRMTLSKLDGDKEKNIFNQIELIIDTDPGVDMKATYEKCFKFADKRMKVIDRPVTAKQTAFQISSPTTCLYCKQPGHKIKDCPEKKRQKEERSRTPCKTWNASEKTCAFEKRTGRKCGFKHPSEEINNVENKQNGEIAWMLQEQKPTISSEVYNAIAGRVG